MSTSTALVSRDGKFWHVEVPEIDRVTQACNITEVDEMARDLIAIMAGVEPNSFELDVRIQLPESVRAHLSEVERARGAQAEARSHAATELRAAAAELKNAGLSVRELAQSSESPTSAPASSPAAAAPRRNIAEPVDPSTIRQGFEWCIRPPAWRQPAAPAQPDPREARPRLTVHSTHQGRRGTTNIDFCPTCCHS